MFGIPDVVLYAACGFLLNKQFEKSSPPPQQPPAPLAQGPQAAHALMPWQGPMTATSEAPAGRYAPGMPVAVEGRKPVGPVALDAHISPETEEGVWRCLSETDSRRARDFAVALAQGGLPVAAGVVSYHVHMLDQIRAAREAQAAASALAAKAADRPVERPVERKVEHKARAVAPPSPTYAPADANGIVSPLDVPSPQEELKAAEEV
jgi:hypothetical protein